jgi:uncharacterized protein with von Willebrand factor type A (vWA) domain
MPALLTYLLAFGRLLRRLGLDVHVGRLLDVVDALQYVDLGRRDDVYHTCRALLVHRHDDLDVFDWAFEAFWTQASRLRREPPMANRPTDRADATQDAALAAGVHGEDARIPIDPDDAEGDTEPDVRPVWSDSESLMTKDFAEFSREELAGARLALERLDWRPGERRTRRWVAGRGSRLDLRRALARSVHTAGDIVVLPRRRRRVRPRPLVLLCDVSGSMEGYSRLLLHFAHAITRRHRRVEAFVFSTRLTRITHHLRARRIDEAVSAASKAVPDWSGGTRIGAALVEFHRQWARRALTGGPIVLLVSDGWDRGEPDVLAAAVARLQRSCHRLVWLNPLIGSRDYEPLTRGLQAALPFVDDFLAARTLRDFADLAALLGRVGPARAGRAGPSAR